MHGFLNRIPHFFCHWRPFCKAKLSAEGVIDLLIHLCRKSFHYFLDLIDVISNKGRHSYSQGNEVSVASLWLIHKSKFFSSPCPHTPIPVIFLYKTKWAVVHCSSTDQAVVR